MTDFSSIIKSRKEEMIRELIDMCKIPSINPRMGGDGEYKRGQWIIRYLEKYQIPYQIYDVEDPLVPEGKRVNIACHFQGQEDGRKTLWLIAHMDTVNTGNLRSWNTDPLEPVYSHGKVWGLGVEDDGQAIIVLLHVCRLIKEYQIQTKCNIGVLFVCDEENGNYYGLRYLESLGLFSDEDEAIIPDGGSPEGDFVQIAEKSQVWLKFIVNGIQTHASTPEKGINAGVIGMYLGASLVETLRQEFPQTDPLYVPPVSTFEITQKYANVGSPNIIPGKDVFVMDMRVLPCYNIDDVMACVDKVCAKCEEQYSGCSIETEFLNRIDAPAPTKLDAAAVQTLSESLKKKGIMARYGGVGGGTCGAVLRKRNIPVVVWATMNNVAHQPNEYAETDYMVQDVEILLDTVMKY